MWQVCYLMNNARRTGVAKFQSECDARGLLVERLPNHEPTDFERMVDSTFAPPWDEDAGLYCFLRVTWRTPPPLP